MLAVVNQFPRYHIEIEEVEVTPSDGASPVEVELAVTCGVEDGSWTEGKSKKGKSKFRDMTLVLTVNSDMDFVDFRKIS